MQWNNWNKRTVAVWLTLLIVFAVVGLTAGCATGRISKDERQVIKTECLSVPACMVARTTALSEEKQHETEARLAEYLDLYRATVQYCGAHPSMSIWRNYPCKRGFKGSCLPTHRTDKFGCDYTENILRQLNIG